MLLTVIEYIFFENIFGLGWFIQERATHFDLCNVWSFLETSSNLSFMSLVHG